MKGQNSNRHKIKFCPKCNTEMEAFTSGNRKVIHDWECPNKKCGYWEITKAGLRELEPAMRDVKEGRTYIVSCPHTKKGLFVCHECHVKDCEKWYRLGKSDMLKKLRKNNR